MKVPELKEYFNTAQLPDKIELTQGTKIENLNLFLESHFRVIDSNPDGKVSQPFYNRLMLLKQILSNE